MQESAFVEKWRHTRNLVAIAADLLEYCKADALSCNGYRSRNAGNFPIVTSRLYVKERAENGPTEKN